MNTFMTKRRIVAERFATHDDGGIVFKQPYDSDMPDAYREQIILSQEIFTELGEPETIAITIEPGDKLNENPDS